MSSKDKETLQASAKATDEDEEECEEEYEECEENEEEEEEEESESEKRQQQEQQKQTSFLVASEQAAEKAKNVAKFQQEYSIKLFTQSRLYTHEFKQEFPHIVKNENENESKQNVSSSQTEEEQHHQKQQKKDNKDEGAQQEESDSSLAEGGGGGGILSLSPFFFMILYLLIAPYTKVEESFNAQAMHDFIFGGGCKVYATTFISNSSFIPGGLPLPTIEDFYADSSLSSSGKSTSYADMVMSMSTSAGGGGGGARISCQQGLANFDHHNFPGVVPRTSLGALIVATAAAAPMRFASLLLPILKPLIFIGMDPDDVMVPMLTDANLALLICRFVLGSAVVLSIIFLGDSLDEFVFRKTRKLNKGIQNVFNNNKMDDDEIDAMPCYPSAALCIIVACTQFHTLYYASRPLPNTFATIGVNLAFGCMLRGMPKLAIFFLSFTTCIFRFDMAVLALPFCLMMLMRGDIGLISGIFTGFASMTATVLFVLPIDSVFWTFAAEFKNFAWMWPELVVLYFNTAKNKSSEWGVSPFSWYFTSALPRGVSGGLALLFLAFISLFTWNRKTTKERLAISSSSSKSSSSKPDTPQNHIYWGVASDLFLRTTLPCLIFITMYSFLPHKELRFILPCFSVLVLPAAYYLSQIACFPSVLRNAGPISKLTSTMILISFVLSLAMITLMINMNKETYPGGKALDFVNQQIVDQRAWHLAVEERKRMKREIAKKNKKEKAKAIDGVEQQKQEQSEVNNDDEQSQQSFTVFIDAFAGMTGVSRFGKLRTIDFGEHDNHEDKQQQQKQKLSINYIKNEQLFNLTDADGVRNSELYGNGIKFDFLIVRSEDSDWHVKERRCGGCRRNLIDAERNDCCCEVMKSFPMMNSFNPIGWLKRGEKLFLWKPYVDVIGFSGSKCYLP